MMKTENFLFKTDTDAVFSLRNKQGGERFGKRVRIWQEMP